MFKSVKINAATDNMTDQEMRRVFPVLIDLLIMAEWVGINDDDPDDIFFYWDNSGERL